MEREEDSSLAQEREDHGCSERASDEQSAVVERCAQIAEDHLIEWANDLAATRDAYIEAQRTGVFLGRRIAPDYARMYAQQFRQRAEAVSEAAEHTAKAIRAANTTATVSDDGKSVFLPSSAKRNTSPDSNPQEVGKT
jgi:hypothetical protein